MTASTPAPNAVSVNGFFRDSGFDFITRSMLGYAAQGVMDVAAAWLSNVPPQITALLKSGNKDAFNAAMAQAVKNPKMAEVVAARGRPFAKPTAYDTFAAALEYNLPEVIGLIRTPLLIIDPDDEHFWPGQSNEMAQQLTGEYEVLHASREDARISTASRWDASKSNCACSTFWQTTSRSTVSA